MNERGSDTRKGRLGWMTAGRGPETQWEQTDPNPMAVVAGENRNRGRRSGESTHRQMLRSASSREKPWWASPQEQQHTSKPPVSLAATGR